MNGKQPMNDTTILTEEEIERIVEKHIEALDRRLMNNDLTQQEYEEAVVIVDKWASIAMKQRRHFTCTNCHQRMNSRFGSVRHDTTWVA